MFDVDCPDLAMLRFVVYNVDMFGDASLLGQATYPVRCLRTGFRSVPLRNEHSEPLELASLLVHLQFRNAKENEEIYTSIQELRDCLRKLEKLISTAAEEGDQKRVDVYTSQLNKVREQLSAKNQQRLLQA